MVKGEYPLWCKVTETKIIDIKILKSNNQDGVEWNEKDGVERHDMYDRDNWVVKVILICVCTFVCVDVS